MCGDSFFCSIKTAKNLYENGLRFTGVMKNATTCYPIRYLSKLIMPDGRGASHFLSTMANTENQTSFQAIACAWIDRNRRFFLSMAGTSNIGNAQERTRWRQSQDIGACQEFTQTNIPEIAEVYYSAAAAVDRHNRVRQADVGLEKKIFVNDWSMRVNCSLLSMCFVDSWLLYKHSLADAEQLEQNSFIVALSHEQIDNKYDTDGANVSNVPSPHREESNTPHDVLQS